MAADALRKPTFMTRECSISLFVLLITALGACPSSAETQESAIEFNAQIRPILSDKCFHCHGPDQASREADLRLDDREKAIEYGAIVPGKPDESILIERITSSDRELVMPPPESHKSLNASEKQLLQQWVSEGANYEQHWAFAPLASPDDSSQPSIDYFIDTEYQKRGLEPSPAASRERWLRRVAFDLTGLPPTVAEIEAFLADESTDAYEKVVDRLLATDAYGERMASEWLDVARYSDTYGYQVDRDRFVWPWRDWVIRAFNDNLSYDDFILYQIAGDLLPDATDDQILATTFNRLHPQKVEGGSVEEEFRVEYVVDRAQTVSTAFMGLTFECCRCHDHKFDPLTQKEFYELNAFFANINESGLYSYHTRSIPTPTLPLPSDQQRAELAQAEMEVASAEEQYDKAIASLNDEDLTLDGLKIAGPVASLDFEGSDAGKLGVELVDGVTGKGAKLTGDRGIGVGSAKFNRWQSFSIALWMQTPDVKERAVVYHRSLGWTDAASRGYQLLLEEGKLSAALVHYWPGNAICVRTSDQIPTSEWLHVVVTYDGSSRAEGLKIYINGQLAKTEIVQNHLTKTIHTNNNPNITIGERTRDRGFTSGLVDGFEIYDRQLADAEVRLRHGLTPLEDIGSDEVKGTITSEDLRDLTIQHTNEECLSARTQLIQARQKRDQLLDRIQEIMVMRELPELRETYFLDRGVYDQRRDRVYPNTPAALPAMPAELPKNRLGLAKWLTSPEHPLTSRVAVNRYWQMIFGRGLVATSEDFGSQGSPPTHPELLDWLAQDFIESGWDVKQLIRRMVLSQAYRRDSSPAGDGATVDPENLWLARGPQAPLTAEMIRDAALSVSGLLSSKIGGSPAKPYELAVSFKPVTPDRGEGLYRRSLYTYWKRTAPAPVMLVLDASTRDVCRVKRERTSSPLQALVLLNGPQYVEAGRGVAANVMRADAKASVTDRLRRVFQTLLTRQPDERELAVLEKLYASQIGLFQANKENAPSYLGVGEFKEVKDLDPMELAALSVVAQMVMNLDECQAKR